MNDEDNPRPPYSEYPDIERDGEHSDSEVWWAGYLSSVQQGERLASARVRGRGRGMNYLDFFIQWGLTILAVGIGFGMGRTTREDPKNGTDNSRTPHSGDK